MSVHADFEAALGHWRHVFTDRARKYRDEASQFRAEAPIVGASTALADRLRQEGAIRAQEADRLATAYEAKASAAGQGWLLVTREEQREQGHRPDQQAVIVMASGLGRLRTED